MKNRLVSIIINCFNGEKYLSKTLNSVLSQNYQNFEVIFIDNCSNDLSAKIFKKINDKRFKYFKTKKKINLYAARNLGLRKSSGHFVAFLDADDWWEKNFLSSKKSFFSSSEKYAFSYANCYHYYENRNKFEVFFKEKLPSGNILDDLLRYYFIKLSTIIVKKKVAKIYRFNPKYNIIGDYDFVIRIAEKFQGKSFQDKLVNIRIHKDNFTHNNRKMFYKEYKHWIENQNFNSLIFKKNKHYLLEKLEYLRLIYLLLNYKRFKLIFDIMRFPSFNLKLKLILIYCIPKFLLRLKIKYF